MKISPTIERKLQQIRTLLDEIESEFDECGEKESRCSCGKSFVFKSHSGMTKTVCTSCMNKKRREKAREYVLGYLGTLCSSCYENVGTVVLREGKKINVWSLVDKNREEKDRALTGCVLVCDRCAKKVKR